MRAHEFLTESQRTLYHGTIIQNVPSIKQHGLAPTYGDFTAGFYGLPDKEDEFYDPEYDTPHDLVFAADKKGMRKCISAIMGALHVRGLPRTVANFYRYGALCVIREREDSFDAHTEWDDNPAQAEPGDYYTDNYIRPDYILVRDKLRSFLARQGFGPTSIACYAVEQGRKPLPDEMRRAA